MNTADFKLPALVLPLSVFISIIAVLTLKRNQVKAEYRLNKKRKKLNAVNIGGYYFTFLSGLKLNLYFSNIWNGCGWNID